MNNNDVVGLQRQVENISNRLDTALHKLAEYQRVVAGAVNGGVYENDNHWWHELCRLANEQAVEHSFAPDGRQAAVIIGQIPVPAAGKNNR